MCENAFSWDSAFMNSLLHGISMKKSEGTVFGNAWSCRAECGSCLWALLGA